MAEDNRTVLLQKCNIYCKMNPVASMIFLKDKDRDSREQESFKDIRV